MSRTFDDLVDEAEREPIAGWDFGWLDGRATEDRPSWQYFDRVVERSTDASAMVDLQTGAATMLASLPMLPTLTVATEGYQPNLAVAARVTRRRGAHLVCTREDRAALPFADAAFDLVVSRHPVVTWWDEIARILQPGGIYLSQQVGPHSLRSLSEFLMGPLPPGSKRDPGLARDAAVHVGLDVVELRQQRLRTRFLDIGAVVYFLRLVVWIVPDFSVERFRPQLRELHELIEREGAFETWASRFLIEARKPGGRADP